MTISSTVSSFAKVKATFLPIVPVDPKILPLPYYNITFYNKNNLLVQKKVK